jgi:hypothetical protein
MEINPNFMDLNFNLRDLPDESPLKDAVINGLNRSYGDLTEEYIKNLGTYPKNRELILKYIIEKMASSGETVVDNIFFPFCGRGENEAEICYRLLENGITVNNIIFVDIFDSEPPVMRTFLASFKNPTLINEVYKKESLNLTSKLYYYSYNDEQLKDMLNGLTEQQINFCIGIQPQIRKCYFDNPATRMIYQINQFDLPDGRVPYDELGNNIVFFFNKILEKIGEFAITLNGSIKLIIRSDYPFPPGITCNNIVSVILSGLIPLSEETSPDEECRKPPCAILGGKTRTKRCNKKFEIKNKSKLKRKKYTKRSNRNKKLSRRKRK